jgi:RND family efflux transporter MFP subunit
MNKRRIKKILCLLAVSSMTVIAGGYLFLQDNPVYAEDHSTNETIRQVSVFEVSTSPAPVMLEFPARIISQRQVDLVFQVAGQLIEFPVREGESVKKGEVLGRVNPIDYENNRLAAYARYDEARLNYERSVRLKEQNVLPQAQLDQARAALEIATASLRIAEKALADTVLYAPFDGRVAQRFTENHSFVSARQNVMTLQNLSQIEVVAQLPERLVARGMDYVSERARAEIAVLPGQTFDLVLSEFRTLPDAYTQTYEVVFTLPYPEGGNLLPGMTATVFIPSPVNVQSNEVLIPLSATYSDASGNTWVWKVGPDSRVSRHSIQSGGIKGHYLIVEKGLEQGERVVSKGVHFLQEGQKIDAILQEAK